MSANTVYKVKELVKTYGNKPVLNVKNLTINSGEIVGVVGSNGSGKSTLLRHLAFLESQDSGDLYYKEHHSKDIPLDVKRDISILLPEPYLLKRSVKENLTFGLKIRGEKDDLDARVNEALELVGLLPKKFANRFWHELSSGETQRVALAARLILKPKTLLLDEPTNSLDISGIPAFTEAILYANQVWGSTIVIASHDLDWLSSIVHRKIGLHFGRVMEFSTTNLILGKWEENGDKMVYYFSDGESMSLPKEWGIGEKRGVAINPRMINIIGEKIECFDDYMICLEGIVKEIVHLTKTDEISVKIQVGNQLIEAIEPFITFKNNLLYPSQKTYICFTQDAVKIPR